MPHALAAAGRPDLYRAQHGNESQRRVQPSNTRRCLCVPMHNRHLVREAMLIALRGAWCFVKKNFNVDFY